MPGPCRIVCLTEEPTEVLYALGESDRIVGICAFTVRPPRARKGEPGFDARCVESHLAPASAAPGTARRAVRTMDGSRAAAERWT
jgi:hypothetical protein